MSQLIVVVGQGGAGSCSGDCSGDNVPPAFGGGGGTHEGNGGGGGYFGGGGGGRQGFWIHAGGGGGSGYVTPSAIGAAINISGSQLSISKDAEAAFKAGLGAGGQEGNGGNGSVTIVWIKAKNLFDF